MECCLYPFPLAWRVCPAVCLFHKSQGLLDPANIQQVLPQRKMSQRVYLAVLLLCLGLMCPLVMGIFMDKLASEKLCADDDCVYTISLARAEEDYSAPDCRFINIKKGQLIYVYSKLVKEKDSGEFWAGSVYGEQYEDHMGTVGYFPSSLVSEQHVYQEANKTVPTTDIDFFCE